MKIAIANDHSAVELKNIIKEHLESKGYEVLNLGTDSTESCDYPVYGEKVGRAVADGEADLGIAICGTGVGISLAALTAAGCEKAAAFANFCNAFEIPVLTLVNVDGYKNCKCNEKKIAKAAARLTYAFANADVPKVTVVVGKANGTAGLTMNSKSIGSDIVYAWKNAKIGVMEAAPAVKIMYADEIAKADNAAALINEKAAQYNEMQASALAAAKRGYVDDIIEASETRQRVVAAFEMLFTKREDRPSKKHGTI